MNRRLSEYKVGDIITDSKTGQLAKILHIDDSRYTAMIKYTIEYIKNGKRVFPGFYKMSNRFKPNPAATTLYGRK